MTKTRRNQNKRNRSTDAVTHSAGDDDILLWLLKAAVAALLVARLLVPTESAADGDTLWISADDAQPTAERLLTSAPTG